MFRFPSPLYAIIDTLGEARRTHLELATALMDGGAQFLQLRIKDRPTNEFVELARAVQRLAAERTVPLLINDRVDIAKLVGATGVHLGQDDLAPSAARQILGADAIIGFSTHSLQQAREAATMGAADYIGFGPIFPTTTKENPSPVVGIERLRAVRGDVTLPIVAIGGITGARMREVLDAGANAVALIADIVKASDVRVRVRDLLASLS